MKLKNFYWNSKIVIDFVLKYLKTSNVGGFMELYKYGEKEIRHLIKADPLLGEIIQRHGIIKRTVIPDPFEALAQNIIAQQISGKAADTILKRLISAVGDITPVLISNTNDEILRNCGLSSRKVSYLKSAGVFFIHNELDFEKLACMEEQDIIQLLTQINGVGVWTAEMLLIFSLGRKNILSYNDFGIRKGLMKLHNIGELNKNIFEEFKELYAPYCSIASFYLWAAAAEKEN